VVGVKVPGVRGEVGTLVDWIPLSLSDETVMSVSLGTDWDFPDLGRGYSSIWSKCSLLAAVVIGRSTIEADVTS